MVPVEQCVNSGILRAHILVDAYQDQPQIQYKGEYSNYLVLRKGLDLPSTCDSQFKCCLGVEQTEIVDSQWTLKITCIK